MVLYHSYEYLISVSRGKCREYQGNILHSSLHHFSYMHVYAKLALPEKGQRTTQDYHKNTVGRTSIHDNLYRDSASKGSSL